MSPRQQRTEAAVEAACDRLIVPIGRGKVDHSPGLPSRRYHVHGVALWWAPRTSRGRISRAMSEFLTAEWTMGQMVGAGDDDALRQVLSSLTSPTLPWANKVAWEHFRRVVDRGLVGSTRMEL